MRKPAVRAAAILIGLMIVALCLGGCGAGGYDWPRWRGPNGDGISRETGWNPKALEGGPHIAWKVDVGGGYSNVAIQNNRVYTMGWDVAGGASVACYCLDASTGNEIWRHSSPGLHAPQATPTVDGSTVYCLSYDGVLSALDAGSGKQRWEKNIVAEYGVVQPYYGFAGSPVIVENVLILTANTSGIALNKRTGEKIWASESPPKTAHLSDSNGTEYHTPVVYSKKGRRYAIVSSWKGVFSVEVETGKPLLLFDWKDSYPSLGGQVADPLIFGEKALIVGYQKKLGTILLDMQDQEAKVLWKNEDTFSEVGSPVFFNGYLYVSQGSGNADGWLRCLDPGTGDMKWEEHLGGGKGKDSVLFTVADGKLVVLNDEGMLSIAEASPRKFVVISSGDLLAGEKTKRFFWTSPVMCNGFIYCRNMKGDLVCIDVRK